MKRLAGLALVLLTACASSSSARTYTGAAYVTEISGPMPELSGETLQGGTFSPEDYRGRVVVVAFWATWCGPCRREQPVLNAAALAAGPDGPVFVGIDYVDDRAAALAWIDEFDVPYPSLEDPSGATAYRFGVPFLPATIFVDATREMRFRVVGAVDARTLADLLAKTSEPAA